jgi:hypothetical protein
VCVPAGRSASFAANEAPFDESKFKTGDEAASCFINPLSGDRADIKVANSWRVCRSHHAGQEPCCVPQEGLDSRLGGGEWQTPRQPRRHASKF